MYGNSSWNKGKHIVEPCTDVDNYDFCPLKGGNENSSIGTDVKPGMWWHWVAVQDYPNFRFYLNGVEEVSQSATGTWKAGTQAVTIGTNTSFEAARSWDGYLDEARVLNVVKDVNWVKLEFESQKEGQKFVTLGPTRKRF
jgi:uncharacterized protein YcsI (UPF0317 family)